MAISTGYQRLDLMNRVFMPEKLVKTLDSRIGKNEQVIISEFLTGNQVGVLQSPYLHPQIRHSIQQISPLSQVWMQKLSKLVSKQRKLQEKCDKNVTYKTQIEKWSHMRLLLRYIEMCQLPHINNPTLSRLMNIIFDKCQEFVQEIPTVLAKFDLPQHRYNTRSQTQKRQKQEQVHTILKEIIRLCRIIKKYDLQ
jgi:hypothetical protein